MHRPPAESSARLDVPPERARDVRESPPTTLAGPELLARLEKLERRLKRTSVLSVVVVPLATALVGSGGVFGAIQYFGNSTLRIVETELRRQEVRIREQDVRMKEQEVRIKETEAAVCEADARHHLVDNTVRRHSIVVTTLNGAIRDMQNMGKAAEVQKLIDELSREVDHFVIWISAARSSM